MNRKSVRRAMKLTVFTIATALLFIGCSYLNNRFGFEDDHDIEEFFEEQIENQTGLDLDLTPSSPEEPVCNHPDH